MILDSIDKTILCLLQQNALISYKEIAQKINLSITPVYERIKEMERQGIIVGYKTIVDNKKLDRSLMIYCLIYLKNNLSEEIIKFTSFVNNCEEIVECCDVTGDIDYILKILVKDMDHFQEFYSNRLINAPNIERISSSFVNRQVKNSDIMTVLEDQTGE
jgi:Lrp/AsnC family leucine-responsive transcriptional regulator